MLRLGNAHSFEPCFHMPPNTSQSFSFIHHFRTSPVLPHVWRYKERNTAIFAVGSSRFYSDTSVGDTIFALASGRGRSGVAVIRCSGPKALTAYKTLSNPKVEEQQSADTALPKLRRAQLTKLKDPQTGEHLDTAISLFFKGPHSFTGEDTLEFHVHGSNAVVSRVLGAMGSIPGLRTALPGEFSRRAVINGKMDLTEAEGMADLINADTDAQRRQALKQMGGSVARVTDEWRKDLVQCLAHVEAVIDFSEDEPVDEEVASKVTPRVQTLRERITQYLEDQGTGERLRTGVSMAIVGPPNAGKSTLLNVLAKRDAAIVSPLAGTTRDVVEVPLDVDGFPVYVADTAGLRRSSSIGVVETKGITRALQRFWEADIRLCVFDSAQVSEDLDNDHEYHGEGDLLASVLPHISHVKNSPPKVGSLLPLMERMMRMRLTLSTDDNYNNSDTNPEDTEEPSQVSGACDSTLLPFIVVLNKGDLLSNGDGSPANTSAATPAAERLRAKVQRLFDKVQGKQTWLHPSNRSVPKALETEKTVTLFDNDGSCNNDSGGGVRVCSVSCVTGQGIEQLKETIGRCVAEKLDNAHLPEGPIITRARHREQLARCVEALGRYLERVDQVEIAAEELREAVLCLGRLTGRVDVEHILDVVFHDFCIGK